MTVSRIWNLWVYDTQAKPTRFPHDLNESYSHVKSHESRNRIVCKLKIPARTVRRRLQQNEMQCDQRRTWMQGLREVVLSVLATPRWPHPCLAPLWRRHIASVHSTSSTWRITWSDGIGYRWKHVYRDRETIRLDMELVKILRTEKCIRPILFCANLMDFNLESSYSCVNCSRLPKASVEGRQHLSEVVLVLSLDLHCMGNDGTTGVALLHQILPETGRQPGELFGRFRQLSVRMLWASQWKHSTFPRPKKSDMSEATSK
ncbi:hypothetical protein LAZ67_X001555 [Cordylochernes scorpioides]|uniref:Transposase Tc1-like domain-containing protein n=1 Tax=Cordylochernes scorpioides TaxID=51811 RepID=A0ABY6LV39_9ARAC|nr:hypothetical protein LAZ67_X001555 [Cordylochernes scorpioides]